MSEAVEEIPVEKPKRKIWKIVLPLVIVILVIGSLVGMYLHADNALDNALSRSFETIYVSDLQITDLSLLPPSADCVVEFTITNPTDIDIRLKRVYLDIWIDGISIGTLTANDKPLPSGGSTVLTCTLHIGSEALNVIWNPPYTIKISGEIVGTSTILFLTVSRTRSGTETYTITS